MNHKGILLVLMVANSRTPIWILESTAGVGHRMFTEHEYDSELPLNYMMARYQDPKRGSEG